MNLRKDAWTAVRVSPQHAELKGKALFMLFFRSDEVIDTHHIVAGILMRL